MADRHLGVVLDDEVLPTVGATGSHRDHVEAHLPVRHAPEPRPDGTVVEGAALHYLRRNYLVPAPLQPPQPLVDGEHALG